MLCEKREETQRGMHIKELHNYANKSVDHMVCGLYNSWQVVNT